MKKLILGGLFMCMAIMPICARAADGQPGVIARTDCDDVKKQISVLSSIGAGDEAFKATLAELQNRYRRDCAKRVSGRRSSGRVIVSANPNGGAGTTVADTCTTPDAYGCCPGETYTDMGNGVFACCPDNGGMCLTPMVLAQPAMVQPTAAQPQTVPVAAPQPAPTPVAVIADAVNANAVVTQTPSEAPQLTTEEKIANATAFLGQGLCTDGTKPNRFGCCGDEVFMDLGNAVFACCPPGDGDCYPPVQ